MIAETLSKWSPFRYIYYKIPMFGLSSGLQVLHCKLNETFRGLFVAFLKGSAVTITKSWSHIGEDWGKWRISAVIPLMLRDMSLIIMRAVRVSP
jgi:hypothetical protein